ncbi:MAG: ABC transporter permease, partial [Planctomycetota bacterium]|nr:ABC transporter permease [Planctomycetota bacterium]
SLPPTTAQRVRGIEGVDWAAPLYKGFLRCQLADGSRSSMIVVGIDDATLAGAPHTMSDGASASILRQDPGILIDERDCGTKLAGKKSGKAMKIGDHVSINDNDAVVVGTYKGSPSFFWDPVVYTTYSRAIRFAPRERNLMSFVLVKCKPGVDVALVKERIEASITPMVARTGAEFEQVTRSYILKSTGILINFGIAIGLGFVIGMLITGQTFFNFTLDNLRYYAALKALGASGGLLVQMVMVQVLSVTWLSFGIGVGIAALMGQLLAGSDLAFLMKWQTLAMTGGAMLLVGVFAALISLWRVLRLEPAIVFKGA